MTFASVFQVVPKSGSREFILFELLDHIDNSLNLAGEKYFLKTFFLRFFRFQQLK